MSKKKRLIKKRKILLSTLVPIGCVGVTLAVVLPLVVKCNDGKATLNSKEDAQKYLDKHKKAHNDAIDSNGENLEWNSSSDRHMCDWFWNTDNYGSQNMVNGFVYFYGTFWSNAHLKKMVIDVHKN